MVVVSHHHPDHNLEALASRLEGLLDRCGGEPERLARLYRRAIELGLAFFQAVWDAA